MSRLVFWVSVGVAVRVLTPKAALVFDRYLLPFFT
jgi:hypothetical protein